MSLFVDASAIVAIMRGETEAGRLEDAVAGDATRLTNVIALWEASMAVARLAKVDPETAFREVERYCAGLDLRVVPIVAEDTLFALRAQQRYGKGNGGRAQLNMGDCFAYACAKTNDAQLLYKGDDFSHTDLA